MRFILYTCLFIVGCATESSNEYNSDINWVDVPEGSFIFGTDTGLESEGPEVEIHVRNFRISETEVTNQQFEKFTQETGYITTAEKTGVSHVFIKEWDVVKGANWRHPEGGDSSIEEKMDHPVVHISYIDAIAYCNWIGGRLPSEVEWEYASKRGENSGEKMNIWDGSFPINNNLNDGYYYSAPVKSITKDGAGLYHMRGNVWEWCFDSYNYEIHDKWSYKPPFEYRYIGKSFDPNKDALHDTLRVVKGGSFLCNVRSCQGYKSYARQSAIQSESFNHIGFRVVRDI